MPYITPQQPMGIFGGSPQPQGIWGPAMGFLGNHSNALMQAGLGLLGGSDPQEGFRNAARGLTVGTEQDQTAADRKRAAADRKKLDEALKGLEADPSGPMSKLSGPMRSYLAASPDAMSNYIGQSMKPADVPTSVQEYQYSLAHPGYGAFQSGSSKREIRNDANGVPRYTDSGEAVYPDDQNASAGTEFFSGRSVQAQGLNFLIKQGMSKEDAANVAAGKVVTGPNGENIFMSPQGLVSTPGNGQQQGGQPQGSNVLTGPKLPEDARKASGFAERADTADKVLSDPTITAAAQTLMEKGLSNIPVGGNYMVSSEYQQFDQAQRNFINANLRRESGAVISDEEFANARLQYFPQPGDDEKTLKMKAENRRQVIESLRAQGSPVPTFSGQGQQPAGVDQLKSKYGLE